MPTTPNLDLPYPDLADSPDVPRDLHALALAIDGLNIGHMVGDFKYSFQPADHTDWVLCDGVARDRAAVPAAYSALIDAVMGVHPDPTKVFTPNGRRRFLAGADAGGATFAGIPPNLAALGGEEKHLLSNGEMPRHNHGGNTGDKNNFIRMFDDNFNPPNGAVSHNAFSQRWGSNSPQENAYNGANHSHPISFDGNNQSHNNLPPFLLANLFIATSTVGGGLGTGGGGGVATLDPRADHPLTTGPLADGAEEALSFPIAASFRLISFEVDRPARIRFYMTAADRDADAARPVGTDPGDNAGVIWEYVATAADRFRLPIQVIGSNDDTPPNNNVYYRVANQSGALAAVDMVFTAQALETV